MTVVNVEILRGLPGSGKSYYAKNRKNELIASGKYTEDQVEIFSFDDLFFLPSRLMSNLEYIIADGLFLTNDSICDFIQKMNKRKGKLQVLNYNLTCWNEDRETCLYNDRNRRALNSENTIRNAVYETFDSDYIFEKTGIRICLDNVHWREVVKKNGDFTEIIKQKNVEVDGSELYSEGWIVEGKVRGYDHEYNSVYAPIHGEERPILFTELVDFLEKEYPDLKLHNFKEICNCFVKIERYEEWDYYSRVVKERYVCNLKDIVEYLDYLGYSLK